MTWRYKCRIKPMLLLLRVLLVPFLGQKETFIVVFSSSDGEAIISNGAHQDGKARTAPTFKAGGKSLPKHVCERADRGSAAAWNEDSRWTFLGASGDTLTPSAPTAKRKTH